MNTPSISSGNSGRAVRPIPGRRIRRDARSSRRRSARLQAIAAPLLIWLVSGCGMGQGQLFYMLGFGRGKKVEAEFRLTDGPVLILLDDTTGAIDWPAARRYLVDELGQEFIKKKAAKKIIPPQTLMRLRQSRPNFEKCGCREIGELAGAEQVLWIEVRDFVVVEQFHDPTNAAYFAVTVKVINVLEKQRRSRVRLWPTSPTGRRVAVSLTGSEAHLAKTRDAISKQLAEKLAGETAKLFYDHRLGDFERER